MIRKRLILLMGVFLFNVLNAQSENYITTIADKAIEVSPEIKSLEAKKAGAVNRIAQGSNLPDPQLSVGLVNLPVNSFSFTQEPMTGKMIALSQGIPFPGKLNAIENQASVDVEIIEEEIQEKENAIRKDVETAYYEFLFYSEAVELAKSKKLLLENISDVVRTRYSVSEASQQNVLNTELSLTDIEDRIQTLENEKNIAVEKLRALVLDDQFTPKYTSLLRDSNNMVINYSDIEKLAVETRPMLAQLKLLELKSKKMEEVAEYEFYPDFKFTLQYNQRDEVASTNTNLHDFLSVIIGLNIPINYGGKKTAKIDESKSFQEYYRAQYESTLQMIKSEAESSLLKMKTFRKRESLITDAKLIQASENFNTALSSYQVNKIDFVNVLDAVNKLLDVETELYQTRMNYLKEISKLSFIAGTDIRSIK